MILKTKGGNSIHQSAMEPWRFTPIMILHGYLVAIEQALDLTEAHPDLQNNLTEVVLNLTEMRRDIQETIDRIDVGLEMLQKKVFSV